MASDSDVTQAKAKAIPMILDVDTGVDDAMAVLLAIRSPEVEVKAITCVHGNVHVDKVTENTLKVLDMAGAAEGLPVAKGFDRPLIQEVLHCPEIHGRDGLGDLEPSLPSTTQRKAHPEHAVQLLNETLRKAEAEGEKVTIVALAPLTNIAVAYRMDSALWHRRLERLYWMGGAVSGGGNARVWSEANASYDPEAAHIMLSSGLPITIYPWDMFMKMTYTEPELTKTPVLVGESDEANRAALSASSLARRLLLREIRYFSVETGTIGDAGVVAAAIRGDAVTTKPVHVQMELHGSLTRGMTVFDLRAFSHPPDEPIQSPNVQLVTAVDAPVLKELFTTRVIEPTLA